MQLMIAACQAPTRYHYRTGRFDNLTRARRGFSLSALVPSEQVLLRGPTLPMEANLGTGRLPLKQTAPNDPTNGPRQ
jgi:hypothetical protein